jgi:hypothetical protein
MKMRFTFSKKFRKNTVLQLETCGFRRWLENRMG